MSLERMPSLVLTYVGPFVLVLGVLIFVHELGHFIVAKALGVRIVRFSLGFGPRIVGVRVGETDYRISALPLGGYVKMLGDETGEATGQRGEFLSAPWWHRALIAAAGPGSNILFALLFAWVALVVGIPEPDYPAIVHRAAAGDVADSLGVAAGDRIVAVDTTPVTSWQHFAHLLFYEDGLTTPWPHVVTFQGAEGVHRVRLDETTALRLAEAIQPAHPPVVGSVLVNLPAYRAGIQHGDSIVAVTVQPRGANARAVRTPVQTYEDLAAVIHANTGRRLTLDLVRRGRPLHVQVTPMSQELAGGPADQGLIGIDPVGSQMHYVRPLSPGKAAGASFVFLARLSHDMARGLGLTVRHVRQAGGAFTGPIGIAQMAVTYAQQGWRLLLTFASVIGLSLAFLNILPIPVLDGGHIAFAVYEGVARRPLSVSAQVAFQRVGLALIGTLFLFVLLSDTVHLFERQRAIHADDRRAPPVEAPAR